MNRTGLVPEDPSWDETTPSARLLGAEILGRALAHMADLGDPLNADWWPGNLALTLGFAPAHAWAASDAYLELLGA